MGKSARLQKFIEMQRENSIENLDQNLSQLPTLGAQLDAMFREGVKDVRQTVMEVYTGKGEHAPEVGAPGNPTQAMTTADLMQTDSFSRDKDAEKPKEGPDLDMG
jgi:hypothetical protein